MLPASIARMTTGSVAHSTYSTAGNSGAGRGPSSDCTAERIDLSSL